MLNFSAVKAKLLVEHPYFGTLASALEIAPNEEIETFTSHENRFEYREDFFETLDEQQIAFALANAAMHTILSHPLRRSSRSPWLWHRACDHAINGMLIDNGFTPPIKITYEERFEGKYAEEIYEILKDEITHDEMNEQDSDSRRSDETLEEKLRSAQSAQLAQNALEKAENMGSVPEGLERLISMARRGHIDWRSELRHTIGGHYVSDFSIIPPSKKLLYTGVYLPGATSRHLELAIAIDSSGSVDEVLLAQFIAEIESIIEFFGSYTITLMVCDDRIRSLQTFTNGESITYALSGGGGTDFNPVFERIEGWMNPPKVLLYFTDLDGKFPPYEPPYETLWVAPVMGEVPFGRVITIKDENG
jgi:predicted metal-dependent peptidase